MDPPRRTLMAMPRHLVCLALLGLLAGCGAEEGAETDGSLRVPGVAAIWEGELPPGPRAIFEIRHEGPARLGQHAYETEPDAWRTSEESSARLRERLVALTAADATRSVDGASRIPAVIAADARTPWGRVLHILQYCAHPRVQIYRLLFRVRRSADGVLGYLPWVLPRFASHGAVGGAIRIRLLPGERGTVREHTRIRVGRDPELRLPLAGDAQRRLALDRLRDALMAELAKLGEARRHARALISIPAPHGLAVAYGDVAAVLGVLLELGVYPDLPADAVEADLGYRRDGTRVSDEDAEGLWPYIVPDLVPLPVPGANDVFRRVATRAEAPATEAGLRWIAAHQAADGGWHAAGFGEWCEGRPFEDEPPQGAGRAAFDVGVSGLAVTAFLHAGYTHRGEHPYKQTIRRSLRYLKHRQDPDGCFGARLGSRWIYNHAAASLALVEAYGMTSSPIYKGSAQRALAFVERCRNPAGVWRYGIRPGDNDTSVTGWMFLPLASARMINDARRRTDRSPAFRLDSASADAVARWLDQVTDASGNVGYTTRSSGASRTPEQLRSWSRDQSASLEALALVLRLLVEPGSAAARHPRLIEHAFGMPATWAREAAIDMTWWRFGALAAAGLEAADADAWTGTLRRAIRQAQRTDGTVCTYKGSWDPKGPWGGEGGRVYATAMMVLCLEAPRAYPRPEAK